MFNAVTATLSQCMTALPQYVPTLAYGSVIGFAITVLTGSKRPITALALGIILADFIKGGLTATYFAKVVAPIANSSLAAKGTTLLASGQGLFLGLFLAAQLALTAIVALAILKGFSKLAPAPTRDNLVKQLVDLDYGF